MDTFRREDGSFRLVLKSAGAETPADVASVKV